MTESGCGRHIDAILDEALPRPDGLEAHLAACPSCRALAASHRGARALPHPEPASPPAVGEREVLARVHRRRVVRGAGAGAGVAAAALAALVLAPWTSRSPEPAGPRGDLFALADGVADLTRRDPLGDDPALGELGAVSDWLAPPRARPFDLDSIAPLDDDRPAGGDAP